MLFRTIQIQNSSWILIQKYFIDLIGKLNVAVTHLIEKLL